MLHQGTPIVVNWNATNSRFEGTSGNLEVWVSPWFQSPNGQAVLTWTNLIDHGGAVGDYWGPAVHGFNSDPSVVAARNSTATYNGTGLVSFNAQDNSFFTSANGPAQLHADFANGTINGSIDLTDCGTCSHGGAFINNTTVTLNTMPISGNGFAGTASLNPADFGMSSVGTVSVSGQFYEANATSVGGGFSASGTAIGGPTTILNGGFLASE